MPGKVAIGRCRFGTAGAEVGVAQLTRRPSTDPHRPGAGNPRQL